MVETVDKTVSPQMGQLQESGVVHFAARERYPPQLQHAFQPCEALLDALEVNGAVAEHQSLG